eukprot:EG_transcript_9961
MSSIKVQLQDVLAKLRQTEGKGQKSILTIVHKNRNTFVELFHLSGLDVDFSNHTFTIHGNDEQMVEWARQRIVSMLQEPLFTVRINPKVIVGMRLLNDAKKHFSVETGCWLHFAWASHTISCYGLNGTAAGQYIHTILQNVDHCASSPAGVDGNIVTEDSYDRRLKPLIKKYVNFIESQTKAKVAVQKDDPDAKEIVVQFYGREEDIAKAKHMILNDLEEMQQKELAAKKEKKSAAAGSPRPGEPAPETPPPAMDLCPIVVSCDPGQAPPPGQTLLLIPMVADPKTSASSTAAPPVAWPISVSKPHIEVPAPPTPNLMPLPSPKTPMIYVSRHSSISSSYEGSVGGESHATSLGSLDSHFQFPFLGLPLRRHTTSVLEGTNPAESLPVRNNRPRASYAGEASMPSIMITDVEESPAVELPALHVPTPIPTISTSSRPPAPATAPIPGPTASPAESSHLSVKLSTPQSLPTPSAPAPPCADQGRSRSHGDLLDLLSALKCNTGGEQSPSDMQ